MNVSKEIRDVIGSLVDNARKVRVSYSYDSGMTTTTLSGDAAITRIEELIKKGEISRLVVKNKAGGTILKVPFYAGIAGIMFTAFLSLPVALAAAGTVILAECEVTIEAEEKKQK